MLRTHELNVKNKSTTILSDNLEFFNLGDTPLVRYKDLRPENALFYWNYTTAADEYWKQWTSNTFNNGANFLNPGINLTATNRLNHTFTIIKGISKKTIQFDFTSHFAITNLWSVFPDFNQVIYCEGTNNGPQIIVEYNNYRLLTIRVFDLNGDLISKYTAYRIFNAGQKYKIEISIDLTVSCNYDIPAIVLYLDGFKQVTGEEHYGQKLIAVEEMAPSNEIIIGDSFDNLTTQNNFDFDTLIIFNGLLHEKNYDIAEVISTKVYSDTRERVDFLDEIESDAIHSINTLVASLGTPATASINFAFKVNNGTTENYYFYNAGSWSISDLTPGQTNTLIQLTDIAMELLLTMSSKVMVTMFVTNTSTIATPIIFKFNIDYNFFYFNRVKVDYTLVYIHFLSTEPDKYEIQAVLNNSVIYKGKLEIVPELVKSLANVSGYAELALANTDDMSDLDFYTFNLLFNDKIYKTVKLKVPKLEKINFEELLDIPVYSGI